MYADHFFSRQEHLRRWYHKWGGSSVVYRRFRQSDKKSDYLGKDCISAVNEDTFPFSLFLQAGISMALDVAILAVPGLGTTTTAQTLCSCSFLLGVGCIFAGTIVHHFGERLKSLDFAVRFPHHPAS